MASQIAEGGAAPRALQHGLVAVVPTHEHGGGQLGLVDHHDVGSLLGDEPVHVLLLLGGVDASDIPHQHCEWDPLGVEVPPGRLLVPLVGPMGLLRLGVFHCPSWPWRPLAPSYRLGFPWGVLGSGPFPGGEVNN